jgi:hypothetical protein
MSNIISNEFKKIFNNAIDTILAQDGLTVPCLIRYTGSGSTTYCNNCIYDPISGLSSNIYNNTGPSFFPDGGVCPVCMGNGTVVNNNSHSETVYLAVIFDSKYWINWSSKSMNIPDGMVQILCKAELLPKLRSASELVIDTNLSNYGNYIYERAGDPEPVGLSNHGYIISMWKRK